MRDSLVPSVAAVSLLGALASAGLGCGDGGSVQSDQPPAGRREITLETVASGLAVPWAMAFAQSGKIFVTERAGHIRVIDERGLRPEPWAEVDVVPPEYRSEGGLLGIAVAPDFETTGHVYVVGTFVVAGELVNRVLRFTDRDGRGVDRTVVVDGLPPVRAVPGSEPAIHTHVGGALGFGPDGMLYLTAGDATSPALAQDPASLAGKLLRYQPDGTIPIANPFPDSPVYALGLRNPQGLAWHPETRTPFVSEHGPSELSWESHSGWFGDELNAIVPGGNYGWPQVVGTGGPDQFIEPLVEWSPSIGPSAVTVYTGPHLPWQGNILVASLRGERLWRIVLERNETVPAGWDAIEREPMMEGRVGRIRAVAMGPDGHLYIATSNRDSRGQPREGDDQIYRVVP